MENKNVGYLVFGIAVLLIVIIALFNSALKDIIAEGCEEGHGTSCPMYNSVTKQTYLAFSIVGILFVVAGVLIFSKPDEKVIIKKVKERQKKKKPDLSKLDKDEKKLMSLLIDEGRAMFQSDIKEKLDMGKVKLTRLLDKLESKQYIERKRRGMNNIVVLKED